MRTTADEVTLCGDWTPYMHSLAIYAFRAFKQGKRLLPLGERRAKPTRRQLKREKSTETMLSMYFHSSVKYSTSL